MKTDNRTKLTELALSEIWLSHVLGELEYISYHLKQCKSTAEEGVLEDLLDFTLESLEDLVIIQVEIREERARLEHKRKPRKR